MARSRRFGFHRSRLRRRDARSVVTIVVIVGAVFVARSCPTGDGAPDDSGFGAARAGVPFTVDAADVRVIDGDTIRVGSIRVRLLGIDAPERAGSYFFGDQEPHASRAREALDAAIRAARRIELVRIKQPDRYQRVLAYVLGDGVNLNAALVADGLAVETISEYGAQGLPDYADAVRAAAANAPRVAFQIPSRWRAAHRRGR